jgi:hypothetical protein
MRIKAKMEEITPLSTERSNSPQPCQSYRLATTVDDEGRHGLYGRFLSHVATFVDINLARGDMVSRAKVYASLLQEADSAVWTRANCTVGARTARKCANPSWLSSLKMGLTV